MREVGAGGQERVRDRVRWPQDLQHLSVQPQLHVTGRSDILAVTLVGRTVPFIYGGETERYLETHHEHGGFRFVFAFVS